MIRPDLGYDLADEIAEAYSDAEIALLVKIRDRLAVGIDTGDPVDWERRQLANLQSLRAELITELAKINVASAARIQAAVTEAYGVGSSSALRDLSPYATATSAVAAPASQAAVATVVAELTTKVESVTQSVLRVIPDIYREVVGKAIVPNLIGTVNRKEAVQAALGELLGNGITVAPASGNGRMSLTNYVMMAVRTGTAQAAIKGHTQALADNNLDFVMISLGPRPCEECDAWANLILWREDGPEGTFTTTDLVTGDEIEVEVDGSLNDARDDGWGHPNCRCGLRAYIPGATKTGPREPWDREGYEAQQQQRYNERQIRDYKTEAALALDPQAEAAALGKVSEWQQAQRDLMARYDYLKRQSDREQI